MLEPTSDRHDSKGRDALRQGAEEEEDLKMIASTIETSLNK